MRVASIIIWGEGRPGRITDPPVVPMYGGAVGGPMGGTGVCSRLPAGMPGRWKTKGKKKQIKE